MMAAVWLYEKVLREYIAFNLERSVIITSFTGYQRVSVSIISIIIYSR